MFKLRGRQMPVHAATIAVAIALEPNMGIAQTQTKSTLPQIEIEQGKAAKTTKHKKSDQSAKSAEMTKDAPASSSQQAPNTDRESHGQSIVGTTGLAVPLATDTLTTSDISARTTSTSDTATLLKGTAGVSIFQGGGVSGMPAINGLNGDRVKILLNGMVVTSACANHMNPPLSYADPTQVTRVEVLQGVTPVSKGGDSIAGTIVVETAEPHFTAAGQIHTAGSLGSFYRSNGHGTGASATAHVATERASFNYRGAWVRSGNLEDGHGDEIRSTEYEAQNHSAELAIREGRDLFAVQGGLQSIPYQAFPNQRMDMVDNQSWFANVRYLAHVAWGKLEAKAFYQHVEHEMNFLDDKKYNTSTPRNMPMLTKGEDAGYSLKAEIRANNRDTIRTGNELHINTLDDWWPPTTPTVGMMGPNTYITINDGTRIRLGTFAEWERQWTTAWSTLIGARNDMVWMNAGYVEGYNAVLGGMAGVYAADASAFNARDHQRTDTNFDATVLARFEPDVVSAYEFGYAMKTRSPNFYERYAWSRPPAQMAMNMIGWFGDGNGYTGNLDLEPERAHTVSLTTGWHSPDRETSLRITPYYTYVDDYIGVEKLGDSIGAAHAGFVNLRFVNHDAELYGVNVTGSLPLASNTPIGSFALTAIAGYVHGENAETGVSLYHMMPFNADIALTHRSGGWSTSIGVNLVAGKHNVDTVRNELETSAYALVNARTSYETGTWRFDLGVENVFDTYYENPLGGHEIEPTMGNRLPSLGGREAKDNVPGQGRSINLGATVKF